MLRFADDIVLLADEKTELEEVLNWIDQTLHRNYHKMVNKKKTKVIVCSRNGIEPLDIVHWVLDIGLDSRKVDEVKEFVT